MEKKHKKKKLDIIYEDKDLLVINKPCKKLTIGTVKDKEHTLYHEASQYVKKQHPKNKIFIVHRLDKDTSGVVILAKNQKLKEQLQANWNNIAKREYLVLVEGHLKKKKDVLKNYLHETKTLDVFISNNSKDKLAITEYEVISSNNNYSLLKVNIKTGRRHQIRAQLAYIGNPIVGDKKYKAKTNPFNRLMLHASRVLLKSLKNDNIYTFIAKNPTIFDNFIQKS